MHEPAPHTPSAAAAPPAGVPGSRSVSGSRRRRRPAGGGGPRLEGWCKGGGRCVRDERGVRRVPAGLQGAAASCCAPASTPPAPLTVPAHYAAAPARRRLLHRGVRPAAGGGQREGGREGTVRRACFLLMQPLPQAADSPRMTTPLPHAYTTPSCTGPPGPPPVQVSDWVGHLPHSRRALAIAPAGPPPPRLLLARSLRRRLRAALARRCSRAGCLSCRCRCRCCLLRRRLWGGAWAPLDWQGGVLRQEILRPGNLEGWAGWWGMLDAARPACLLSQTSGGVALWPGSAARVHALCAPRHDPLAAAPPTSSSLSAASTLLTAIAASSGPAAAGGGRGGRTQGAGREMRLGQDVRVGQYAAGLSCWLQRRCLRLCSLNNKPWAPPPPAPSPLSQYSWANSEACLLHPACSRPAA